MEHLNFPREGREYPPYGMQTSHVGGANFPREETVLIGKMPYALKADVSIVCRLRIRLCTSLNLCQRSFIGKRDDTLYFDTHSSSPVSEGIIIVPYFGVAFAKVFAD